MLPADSDDERRARLTHEHSNGLGSSTSSPSLGTPTFNSRRRSKSPSHQHSHTTTNGSKSSHLLARLISQEEEVRKVNATLVVTNERFEAETSRANAAERRALDYFHRLRIATENCERTEQESTRLREELKLCKLQLENSQKETVRAQDIIDQVVSERNEAEAEAARARIKARKLQEKLVVLAREEHRIGYQEGLSMGRGTGNGEGGDRGLIGPSDGPLHIPLSLEHTSQNEQRNQDRHHSSSTEVESIANQWYTDDDASLRKPLRSFFSSAFPHPHRSPNSYGPRKTTATRSHPPPDDPAFQPTRIRSPPEFVRHHLHQPRPSSGSSSGSSPNIIVESPSEPETTASQPELLSPEAANRPLPQDDAHQHLRHHRPSRAHSQLQFEPPSHSRHEHRDHVRHHSRTQAESIVAQWRADNDASPSQNQPHLFTPSGVPQPHRVRKAPTALGDSNPRPRRSVPTESAAVRSHPLPDVPASPHPYSRSEIVTPMPVGDVNDHRPPRRVPTESAAMLSHPLPDDSTSLPAPTGLPLENLRQPFRQRRRGSGSSSLPDIIVESPSEPETTISSSESSFRQLRRDSSSSSSLNIIVESPSEPEMTMSPSAMITAHPELLSPEAANRPLPQDDVHEYEYSRSRSQPQPSSRHHNHTSSPYDAPQHSGVSSTSWPAGFVPTLPGHGTTSSSKTGRGPGRDHRHARAHPTHTSAPHRNATTQNGHVRTHTSTSKGRGTVGGTYKAAQPVHPHRRHRERDRDRDRDGDRVRE